MREPLDLERALEAIFASDVDGLLDAPEKPKPVTNTDRCRRGYQEIVDFFRQHGREPDPDTREISERKLGARLVGFRADPAKAEQVQDLDTEFNLLKPASSPQSLDDILNDDALNLLGGDEDLFDLDAIPGLAERQDEFEVAKREKAKDFEQFDQLFKTQHEKLRKGDSELRAFSGVSTIKEGRFFVLNGIMLFIAEVGETEKLELGKKEKRLVPKERLRVIFENGTESSMYRQSLAGRLGEHSGQMVVPTRSLELNEIGDADTESGHIYVLRSKSEDPAIKGLDNLHKIGYCTTPVSTRVHGAEHSPTYLMAPVEVVADYRVYNLRTSQLETLLHRVFAEVRLDLTQTSSSGENYDPSEWFLVPYSVIDKAIDMIISGDITDFIYDKQAQDLVWRGTNSN